MREAKAEYYEALAGLKNADAAKVLAEAEVEKAKAAVENAIAAQEQAKATILELKAEAAAMDNEKKAAEVAAKIAEIEADAALAAVKAEEDLAKAEAKLAKTLDDLAVQAEQLTPTEQLAVKAYVTAYEAYLAAQKKVYEKETALYMATYNDYGEDKVEAAKADYESKIAVATVNAARNQALYDEYEKMSEEEIAKYDVWAAEYEMLQDSIYAYEYEKAELKKAAEVAKVQNKEAIDNFFKAVAKAQEPISDYIEKAKDDFVMDYTGDNAFELPSSKIPVVGLFRSKVNQIDYLGDNYIKVHYSKDYMDVKYTDSEKAFNAIFGDVDNPDNASLASIIDALKRDSVVVDNLVKDTAGLAAAVAKVNDEYKAVKDTLVKGVAAYKPLADAKVKAAKADTALQEAKAAYAQDTTELFASLKNFVKVWNEHADGNNLDHNDSLAIWNAIKEVATAREFLPESKTTLHDKAGVTGIVNAKKFYYYNVKTTFGVQEPVLDSVEFTKLEFSGIQRNSSGNALYAGRINSNPEPGESPVDWNNGETGNAFRAILAQMFDNGDKKDGYVADKWVRVKTAGDWINAKTNPIKEEDLFSQSNKYAKILYNNYRINSQGKIWIDNVGEFVSKAVADATIEKSEADEAVNTAKDKFYKNIYCKFWGLTPSETAPADSLKINYSEKTYTDPYVLPVFEAKHHNQKIFANGEFVWSNIAYNENDSELKLIAEQLGQNNIKIKGAPEYTLYAKTLAAAQIEDLAKNWKENTAALAELEVVVASVEAAYILAGLEGVVAQAKADSVVTAVLGEDIVKKALAEVNKTVTDEALKKTARYLWNDTEQKAKWFVGVTMNPTTKEYVYDLDAFTTKFCQAGKFNLGGQQLAAAEANIPDYAEAVAELSASMEFIKEAQENCKQLAGILNEYVQEIAKLDKNFNWGDAEDIDAVVRAKWAWVLASIQGLIDEQLEIIAVNEGNIKKLEAGYDQKQIDIEAAQVELAKAEAALEAAETKLAAATAAYQQVLENHDME